MAPKGPYKLCTVNTAPERAKRLVGRVVLDVKDEYTILHVENAESMSSFALLILLTKESTKSSIRSCRFCVSSFHLDMDDVLFTTHELISDSNRNRRCQGNV